MEARLRTFKTRAFTRWARREGVADRLLLQAVAEIESGLVDARIGGGLYKKRIAVPGRGRRGGARAIVAGNLRDRWIFLYGFSKNEKESLEPREERDLKRIAQALLDADWAILERALDAGHVMEVGDG